MLEVLSSSSLLSSYVAWGLYAAQGSSSMAVGDAFLRA